MFYLHMGNEEFGGELFGSYDKPEEAAQAAANILLKGFKMGDGVQRAFHIVKASSKRAAEKKVYAMLGISE
jgi:hypothetical protein